MEYRRIGKSGVKVSEIGLGTLEFGRRLNELQSISIIDRALDLGINFIDTADVYSDGLSEEFIGKALRGKRSSVILATKFGISIGNNANDYGGSRSHIMTAVEASLKRLGTDYIDLYYIHWPDPTTPIEETLRTLNDLVRTGKVRYIACSNFAAWQLCEAIWTSRLNNLECFVGVQTRYNLIHRDIESELVPCCQSYDIGVIPWGPLADGFLTGKYQRGKPATAGTRLGSPRPSTPPQRIMRGIPGGPHIFASILTESNYDILEKLQKFSMERGHTVGELAISWLLSHPWLTSVIAGVTSPEQVSINVAAANWRLTEEEKSQLNQAI